MLFLKGHFKANKHFLMRTAVEKPPSRSRMDGSADSILWGPETAPWGPDRAPCLPPDLAETAGPPPMAWVCKLLAGSASALPQSCQVVFAWCQKNSGMLARLHKTPGPRTAPPEGNLSLFTDKARASSQDEVCTGLSSSLYMVLFWQCTMC